MGNRLELSAVVEAGQGGGRFAVGILGMALALTPLPLAYWLFQWCARVKGYGLAP